jgi:hypothetical protein
MANGIDGISLACENPAMFSHAVMTEVRSNNNQEN